MTSWGYGKMETKDSCSRLDDVLELLNDVKMRIDEIRYDLITAHVDKQHGGQYTSTTQDAIQIATRIAETAHANDVSSQDIAKVLADYRREKRKETGKVQAVREIIFRGKRVDNNEWVYGGFHKHLRFTPSPVGPREEEYDYLILTSGFSDWNLPKPLERYAVEPKTIGQYVGLNDDYGEKIFEGDIVYCRNEDYLAVITFDYVQLVQLENVSRKVIVGNVYDNPELLSDDGFNRVKKHGWLENAVIE